MPSDTPTPQDATQSVTEENVSNLSYKSTKMTGALNTIEKGLEEKKLEEPILEVKVNNPITKLLKWLSDIKKKQTTTFTMRLAIPLIALPVLVAAVATAFYSIGKASNKVVTPVQEVKEVEPEFTQGSKAGQLKIIDGSSNFLILPSGETLTLNIPENINAKGLDGKRILATGKFYSKTQTLIVENVADLEILPISPKPLPTESPAPTITEIPTPSIEVAPTN